MADKRYEWLDRDAAERLLRGEPVEATDERARVQAARLSETLNSARSGAYWHEDGELPGEAAAMAAYGKVRAEAADAAGPVGDSVGAVRVVRRGSPSKAARTARPVRFGIAAAVAGCALGGVAVAAGAGVLPAPFGGHGNPLPASSVSAAATPRPLVSEPPTGQGPATPAQPPGGITTSPAPTPADGGSPAPGQEATRTPDGQPSDEGREQLGKDHDGTGGELYRRSVKACEDYRSGRIDWERKRRLEDAAKGAERVERFCDRLLGGDSDGTDSGDVTGGDDRDSGSGDSNGSDSDDRDSDQAFVGGSAADPLAAAVSRSSRENASVAVPSLPTAPLAPLWRLV
ncbi:hypothetical protein OHS70_13970 [Streptomyces sp. NBC_00390]|uniref:hypothetical protein n=1 Tax=Streptomyces sp. NBC_00390 TaxID=2975736 RepID=UPI002E1AC14F